MDGPAPQTAPSPPTSRLSPGPTPVPSTPMMFKTEKPPVYSSPPPVTSNPENNTCKLIDYRGAKVAAFTVDGRELICLPQAFDLFLKHLVGGLHTVYTKLKRLDITPIVCNVEQVRILRGLGAIQPGVNRCKLISPKEFDILYEDCTNSSARPGRPPKRNSSIHANPETLEKLKKSRLDNGDYGYSPRSLMAQQWSQLIKEQRGGQEVDPTSVQDPTAMLYSSAYASLLAQQNDPKKSQLLSNGYHYPHHMTALPFLPMGHPMMSMAIASHLGLQPDGSMMRDPVTSEADLSSPRYRSKEEKREELKPEDNNNRPLERAYMESDKRHHYSSTDKESGMSTPSDSLTNGQLDLSRTGIHSGKDSIDADEEDSEDDKDDDMDADDSSVDEMGHHSLPSQTHNGDTSDKATSQNLSYPSQVLHADNAGISSIETLLMNIQGLLKVAAENARHHERQINYEKAELKMEILRERELRENIEKQLMEEQRNRATLHKRLKKERKARRKMQEQLEMEQKRRVQVEGNIKQTSPDSQLRMLNESSMSQDKEMDRRVDTERKMQEARGGIANLMESLLAPKSCNGSASNGYVPSPVIKPTESVQ